MNKVILSFVLCLMFASRAIPQNKADENQAGESVKSFYAAFNSHDFSDARNYTAEDWVHINPFGGSTHGREATLKDLHEVHSTFLKGVTDKIDELTVRLVATDVAIVTVTSHMSTFTTPNGVKHDNQRNIRTFVVVKQNGLWLIAQDQNTRITSINETTPQ